MSQRNVEQVIGRLATDEEFCRRFEEGREAVLEELIASGVELTAVEQRALLAFDFAACKRFAGSLDPRLRKLCLRRARARLGHLTLLAAALLLVACGRTDAFSSGGARPVLPALPVGLEVVERSTVQDSSEYVATLRSRRSITLNPRIDGYVREIFVKSGDQVKVGAPLMQIDASGQRASVRSQEATLLSRQADLTYARREHGRTAELFEKGVVSRRQLEQAEATLGALQASVDALRAQLGEEEVRLGYFRIDAPADGIVGDIPVREGDYVTPQTLLTTLDQSVGLEAYVSVPVERAGELQLGMPVVLVGRKGARLGDTQVSFISPQVNDGTQSILVKADVENPTGELRSEQFIRARLVWRTREAPTIPAVAVTRLNGETFAFVAHEEQGALVARQRLVELGEIAGNRYVVERGIEPGEQLVVSGIQRLSDGASIRAETAQTPGPSPLARRS